MKAGDAIIFTEAMTHGTFPWTGTGERRTLFFKYTPRELVWMKDVYHPEEMGPLSERQRAVFDSPGIAGGYPQDFK